MGLETQQPLEAAAVKSDNHLVVHGDDWDRQLAGLLNQLLPGLGVLGHVDILKRDPLRRKKLFRQLAGHSRRGRVDGHSFH